MTLDRLMFDNCLFYPFAVTVGFVRAEAYVRPLISDFVIIHVLFKGEIFEFIERRRTKKWMVLGDSHQEWF